MSIASEILEILRTNRAARAAVGAGIGGAVGSTTNGTDPWGGALGGAAVGGIIGGLSSHPSIPEQIVPVSPLAEDLNRWVGKSVEQPLVPVPWGQQLKSKLLDVAGPLSFGDRNVEMRLSNLIHGGANEVQATLHPLIASTEDLRSRGLLDIANTHLGEQTVDPAWHIAQEKRDQAFRDMTIAHGRGNQAAWQAAKEEYDHFADILGTGEVATHSLTPEQVEASRAATAAQLGPEDYARIQAHGDLWDRNLWSTVEARHARGEFSDELYQRLAARREAGAKYFPATKDARELTSEGLPIERRNDQIEYLTRRQGKIGLSGLDGLIKSLKGSTLPLANPSEAGFRYMAASVQDSKMNDAAKTIIDGAMRNAPARTDGTPFVRELLAGNDTLLPGEGSINFVEKGVTRHFAVPVEWADMLHLANAQQVHTGMQIMGKMMRMNSAMLTSMNLLFLGKNVLRDLQAAAILVRQNPKSLPAWAQLYGQTLYHSAMGEITPAMHEAMQEGAIGGNLTQQLRWQPEYQQALSTDHSFGGGLVHTMQRFTNATEMAPKVATYKTLTAGGMSPIEAAFRARRYAGSPDFARFGSIAPGIRPWVQFWNPQIQGMARNVERAREDPAYLAMWTGTLATGYLALDAYNRSFVDPNTGRPYIEDMDPSIRTNNLVVMDPTGNTEWSNGMSRPAIFTIPLDHITRLVLSPFMSLLQMAHGEPGAPSAPQAVSNAVSQVLPIPGTIDVKHPLSSIGSQALSTTNPVIQTLAEEGMNMDAYSGRPIETDAQQRLDPVERYTESTSPTARTISQLMAKVGLGHTNLASPVRIEHVIQSMLPGVGQQVLKGLDFSTRTEMSPTELMLKVPGINALTGVMASQGGGSAERRRLTGGLYDTIDAGEQASATLKTMEDREEPNPELIDYYKKTGMTVDAGKALQPMAAALSELAKEREFVMRHEGFTPQRRRELLAQLTKAQMDVLREAAPILHIAQQ